MSHNNPLTVKRHQEALAKMIVDIMANEDLSLLEAYAKLASMATSDEVVTLAKITVETMNGSRSYDYERQCWVVDGVIQDCNHPEAGAKLVTGGVFEGCNCYGRAHAGELTNLI